MKKISKCSASTQEDFVKFSKFECFVFTLALTVSYILYADMFFRVALKYNYFCYLANKNYTAITYS